MMTLSEFLKAHNISQRDFASLVQIKPNTLNEIIKGKKSASLALAVRISEATNGQVPHGALLKGAA